MNVTWFNLLLYSIAIRTLLLSPSDMHPNTTVVNNIKVGKKFFYN